jgi:hypothetical protein
VGGSSGPSAMKARRPGFQLLMLDLEMPADPFAPGD